MPGYKGAPFIPHATMPIGAAHFNQWLHLFAQTLEEKFSGPLATDALQKAKSMAAVFQHRLQEYKLRPQMIPLA
jgi:hemoglobin